MKCKETRTVMKHKSVMASVDAIGITNHVETCPACRDLLLLDRLAPAIIKAGSASNSAVTRNASSAVFISRIRNRVQELCEQHASSWELAMESMRGWLAAFAAAAVVLIAASIQWQPSVITSDFDHDSDELITQNPAEDLISDIPDPVGLAPVGKDNPYARK